MKTVQEYLREADRGRLLDSVAYDEICNTELLLEYPDKTIAQIQEAGRRRMNDLIDHLLSLKAMPTDCMVLYLTTATLLDRRFNHELWSLDLIDLNKIRKDIYVSGYAFELTDWEETLGYLVAENKLTQDHTIELLTQYLHEISFFGADPELHRKEVDKVHADLEQAMQEIEEGKCTPAEEVFEEIARKHGGPIAEKDDRQDALRRKVAEAEIQYSRYCSWRERSRILENMGESAPAFVELPCHEATVCQIQAIGRVTLAND